MSKLLQEWTRLAFSKGTRSMLQESDWEAENNASPLAPLRDMGFYFAGSPNVVLGDLDSLSGKEFRHNYPYDEYMGQGPMHVQISVEPDGLFRIHNYSEVDDAYCTGSMPKKGHKYSDLKEVSYAIEEMVACYEEWMDAYCQIRDEGGTLDNEEPYAPAFIMDEHPAAQALRKK